MSNKHTNRTICKGTLLLKLTISLMQHLQMQSHDLISYRILASSSPILWGSAGHFLSKVHRVLSINLNLDVYNTNPCHLDYTKSLCSRPINHWNRAESIRDHFRKFTAFFPPFCLLFLYRHFTHIRRSTVCFSTGARNGIKVDMLRNKTGHRAVQIENM